MSNYKQNYINWNSKSLVNSVLEGTKLPEYVLTQNASQL